MSMSVRFIRRSPISNRQVSPGVRRAMARAEGELDRQAKVIPIKPTDGTDSKIESDLLHNVRLMGLPEPELQAKLVPGRRFRFDLAWRAPWLVAAEVQGGVYGVRGGKRCATCGETPGGRHTRGSGYEIDAQKSALAQIQGYICIYVTTKMIRSGEAAILIRDALTARGWTP